MASQPDTDGLSSRVEIHEIGGENGSYEVAARRVQHWTETNELASDEELTVLIDFDEQGLITRAQMSPRDA
jgi:5S rRNA maturation endonuclease (ribonuclease M5)